MTSETRKITELREWDKNPRSITVESFDALKNKIKRWGQFKPVLITKDGEVIGGNMRLKAYKELGIVDIWCSIVEPKTEAEKVEMALADNELAGRWDEQQLAELIEPFKTEIDMTQFDLDMGTPVKLEDLVNSFGPPEDKNKEIDTDTLGDGLDCECPKCGFRFKKEKDV